ncbi:MAG: CapA family protein, partial [Ardenticatenaceae bacterium]
KFELGEEFKISTSLNKRDLDDNLRWIRDARRMADWVIVTVHCHEHGKGRDEPPDFLRAFAKACIDEGAHIFIGHGPHVTRGIEIYKDRPILYSLGNFIFQNDTVRWQPSHNYDEMKLDHYATPADFYDARSEGDTRGFPGDSIYWESVVVRCEYKGGKLKEVRLYPIDLGHNKPRSQRGRPMMADDKLGKKILDRMKRLSRAFDTNISLKDGVGVIRV